MATNVLMLQGDELKTYLFEILQPIIGREESDSRYSNAGEDYYTRDETCYRLRITFTTLWRMEKRGILHVHKVGRRSLYAKSDVDALLANGLRKEDTNNH